MRVMNPDCWSARTGVTALTVLLLALIALPGDVSGHAIAAGSE